MCSTSPAARRLAVFDAAAEKLAAAFWPGPLTLVLKKRARLSGRRACHRRARQHRRAGAAASGGARILRRARPAGGGALRQSLRPGLADHGAACDGRSRRPHRLDRRWRADAGRRRIHHRRLSRPPDAAAARRAAARADRSACSAAARRSRRSGPFDPEAPIAPGMLESHYAPRARLRLRCRPRQSRRGAARVRHQAAGRRRERRDRAQSVAERRSASKPRPICFPTSARSIRPTSPPSR